MLKREDGAWVEDQAMLKSMVREFFHHLFKQEEEIEEEDDEVI